MTLLIFGWPARHEQDSENQRACALILFRQSKSTAGCCWKCHSHKEILTCPSGNVPLAQKPHTMTGTGHEENTEKHPLMLIFSFLSPDFASLHRGLFLPSHINACSFTVTLPTPIPLISADAQVNKYSYLLGHFFDWTKCCENNLRCSAAT